MWKILVAAVAVVAAVMLLRSSKLPIEYLPSYSQGAQEGSARVGGHCLQDKCLTVYVAPWCRVCVQMHGTIVGMRQQLESEGIGVQLVLGMDKPPALIRYAQTFEQPVLLDDQGAFKKKAGIKAVPYFVVTNRKGEIVKDVFGGYNDVGTMRSKLGI
jgi:hypothetical protein